MVDGIYRFNAVLVRHWLIGLAFLGLMRRAFKRKKQGIWGAGSPTRESNLTAIITLPQRAYAGNKKRVISRLEYKNRVVTMNTQRMKYWSWMGAFSVSMAFWLQIIWLLCR